MGKHATPATFCDLSHFIVFPTQKNQNQNINNSIKMPKYRPIFDGAQQQYSLSID